MKLTSPCFKGILTLFSILIFSISTAQVGIGTTTPNSDALLDVDATITTGGVLLPRLALTSTASFAPLSAHVAGMVVYNTVTVNDVTPGLYFNDGMKWVSASGVAAVVEPPIDSVTLAADYSLGVGAFSDVPAMSLTFVARKTSVLVSLTGSGDSSAQVAAAIGDFRVYNVTAATSFGGTHEKLTTYDNFFGVVSAAWSIAFTKPLTGLTVGNTYTLKVQALMDPILSFVGPPPVLQIFPVTLSSDHHLTLSVMQ